MVFEVLSQMISKEKLGFLRGFEVGHGGVLISHLQFADDTMIFCDANVGRLDYLRCILVCFQAVLGLNINLSKSEIFLIGEECDIKNLAWILGCKFGSLLSSYLAMPLGASYKSKAIWILVMDIISSRLDS